MRFLSGVTIAVCALVFHATWAQVPESPIRSHAIESGSPPADVASPPDDAITTSSGLAMKVLAAGTGAEHPGDNDCIVMVFRAWRRDGSLFSTSGTGGEPITQCLRPAMPGVAEALEGMVKGEERRVWIPAHLTAPRVAHHADKASIAHDGDHQHLVDLTLDIHLIGIFQAPPTPADLRSPPRNSIRLASGLYMQILKAGTGDRHPSATSWVQLDYTGWTPDGKLFESTVLGSQPRSVLIGMALPGWQEALLTMVVGEKVRIWVPAALAYGEHPTSRFAPAGDLVYDLELLAFT